MEIRPFLDPFVHLQANSFFEFVWPYYKAYVKKLQIMLCSIHI